MRPFMPFLCSLLLLATGPRVTAAGLVTSPWAPKGGQAGAAFGASVAPAGDVNGDGWSDVLVGAPLFDNGQVDEGRAYLYLGGPTGLSASAAWTFESNQANAHAGAVVASAGDVNYDGYFDVLVAAPEYDRPGHADAGAVFVFYGSAQGLHAAPDDTLANDVTGALFGTSVGYAAYTNNDLYVDVVIGAPGFSNGQVNEGAVYVYNGGTLGFAAAPSFTFESNDAGARAGQAVGGGGDVNGDGYADVIVGEPGASTGGHAQAGRIIVLPGSSTGVTTAAIALVEGSQDSLAVGTGVASAGDVDADGYADVLVGVPGEGILGTRRGGFRCYRGTPSGLDPTPLFSISATFDQSRAGAAVATAGDIDGDGYADFAFGDPNGFVQHQGWLTLFYGGRPNTAYGSFVGGTQTGSRFAAAVATAGDIDGDGMSELLVGAPDWSETGLTNEGAAFLFMGKPALPSSALNSPLLNNQGTTGMGSSLAILPQAGFGFYPTLLVGEPGYDVPTTDLGSVRRYDGRISGFDTGNFTRITGGTGDGLFGQVVVNAGDVDHDGFPDFVVGSPFHTSGSITERGRVVLYRGTGIDWIESPWVAQGTQAEERYATAIAAGGDVNGDGYSDIAVGGYNYVVPPLAGKVSVYYGGPAGPGSIPSWIKTGTTQYENYGYKVAMLDFDADGYSDLAVAAASVNAQPRVDIFYGGPGGLSANPAFSLSAIGPIVPTYASEVAGVGDFDGDGVDDLVVGAPEAPNGEGTIYFYPGSRARSRPGSAQTLTWTATGFGQAGAGTAIAGGGDLNGDGHADFVVGAPHASNGEATEGVLFLFRGHPGTGAIAPDTLYQSDVASRGLGTAIAPLADLNGDGYADIVASGIGANPDALYAFLGGGEGTYFMLGMNEACCGGIRKFAPAVMDSATQAGFAQMMRSAAGRTRVTAQVEMRIQGQPFSRLPTTEVYFLTDTFTPGPTGSQTGGSAYAVGLFPRVAYRVRGRSSLNSPYFPHTRWIAPDGRETIYDFRTSGSVIGVFGPDGAPVARLGRIAPNPARGAVQVAFELPGRVQLRLDVYDVRGRHVRSLARELAGSGARTWDGTDAQGRRVPPGLYFVELRSGDAVDRGRIVLMN